MSPGRGPNVSLPNACSARSCSESAWGLTDFAFLPAAAPAENDQKNNTQITAIVCRNTHHPIMYLNSSQPNCRKNVAPAISPIGQTLRNRLEVEHGLANDAQLLVRDIHKAEAVLKALAIPDLSLELEWRQ